MKSISFLYLALFLFLTNQVSAQSIHFTSPTDGQIITETGYGSTESTVPVNVTFYYSITPYPPRVNVGTGIKLITHDNIYDSREEEIPQWFYLESNTYTWRVELWEFFLGASSWEKTAEQTISFYIKYPIISLNNFGGGLLNVDGQQKSHGFSKEKLKNEVLQVGAID